MLSRLRYYGQLLTFVLRYRADSIAYYRSLGARIGRGCSIYSGIGSFGSEPWLIEIGNGVTVAGGVMFLTHDGASRLFRGQYPDMHPRGNRFGTIRIRDNCFIGYGTILLPDIEIGPDSIVGSGSVVTRSVPPQTVVAGNPARPLCSLAEYIERYRAKMLFLEDRGPDQLRRDLTTKLWGEER